MLNARHRRDALKTLDRDRLDELTSFFQLEVGDRRKANDHVSALVRHRSLDFRELLRMLQRDELQAICGALDLDRTGREKDVLIKRIMRLGDRDEAEESTIDETRAFVATPGTATPSNPAMPPPSWGIAPPVTSHGFDQLLALKTDGPCVTETLNQLERGYAGKPMPRQVLDKVRLQAESALSDILTAYSANVAKGEVGAHGSARASAEPPIGGKCPTGLLYGRIQSGKTNAMIITTALALDNGFRTIVVFTSNFVKLVHQTLERFRVLGGPLLYSSTEAGNSSAADGTRLYQWDEDIENIRQNIGKIGVVLICAKDANHQRALLKLLKDSTASEYPALIFDDEADQATPDTTTASRVADSESAPLPGSVTYRLTVENDAEAELGDSTKQILRHNVFVQVTATPYALLLQSIDSPIRPRFTRLLEPGDQYTGGEDFFSTAQVNGPLAPLVFVDEDESKFFADTVSDPPIGLARAIAFFLLSSTAYQQASARGDAGGYKFLCHTSPKTVEHTNASRLIRALADSLSSQLSTRLEASTQELFEWAHRELLKSLPQAPGLDVLLPQIARRLPLRKVLTINASAAEVEFGPSFNFMVGGNILGRGLTIENLLVTYYLRSARTTQMDTMLQHARMYGYRRPLMQFTRVFLPDSLAVRFNRIHEAEETLRRILQDANLAMVPINVASNLRPTRRGVVVPTELGYINPGQQGWPSQPEYRREHLGTSYERIEQILG